MTDRLTIDRLLDVEPLEMNLFRGQHEGGPTNTRTFGGLVIAQSLAAAYNTVEERLCHSLHAYFIRAGDPNKPIIYEVDRARDGGSFTTRRVIAIQNGKQILNMSASFHVEEEGWAHQHDMPDAPGPEGLTPRADMWDEWLKDEPEKTRRAFPRDELVDVREVDPQNPVNPVPKSDRNMTWIKAAEMLEGDPKMHHCVLAYASDMALLSSGSRPHGASWYRGDIMGASLDHAMWFHGPLNMNDWHLYSMDAPFTGGGRAFNRGSIYTRNGRLAVSVAQEGLMRPLKKKG
ncbi:MAG: acyl-CoA thioesterase II [Pseudomonadota bacterium]